MALRHTVFCKRSVAAGTPEQLLGHLGMLDFLTLGEDYGLPVEAVEAARPLRIENIDAGPFCVYHLRYGNPGARPIAIERWESEDQRRAAVDEAIDNLEDGAPATKISDFL